jgi:hypothetical protein
MEQVAPKQRSPWLYVLLGCGGFALLSCLGVAVFVGFVAKQGSNMVEGLTDPTVRDKNARKMLGDLPPGYLAAASMSVLGIVDLAVLTNGEAQPDGGVELGDRTFMYMRISDLAKEENERTKVYFVKGEGELGATTRSNGINIDEADIIKRGNLTVDGRRLYYIAARGQFGVGNSQQAREPGLNTSVLFDCPGDQLRIGVWSMRDPDPKVAATELDLTATVADEAQLARFLKPVNPCGR